MDAENKIVWLAVILIIVFGFITGFKTCDCNKSCSNFTMIYGNGFSFKQTGSCTFEDITIRSTGSISMKEAVDNFNEKAIERCNKNISEFFTYSGFNFNGTLQFGKMNFTDFNMKSITAYDWNESEDYMEIPENNFSEEKPHNYSGETYYATANDTDQRSNESCQYSPPKLCEYKYKVPLDELKNDSLLSAREINPRYPCNETHKNRTDIKRAYNFSGTEDYVEFSDIPQNRDISDFYVHPAYYEFVIEQIKEIRKDINKSRIVNRSSKIKRIYSGSLTTKEINHFYQLMKDTTYFGEEEKRGVNGK